MKRTWVLSITLLVLVTLYGAFLAGLYDPLALVGFLSLLAALPALLAGTLLAIRRGRWFSIALGALIPPAVVATLVAAMSDYPSGDGIATHMIHGALLFSCPFACWLFLSVASGPKRLARGSPQQSTLPGTRALRRR